MDYLENVLFEKTSGNFINRATMMRSYIRNVSSIFALLSIIFIPFPFHLFQIQIALTDFLFGGLIKVSAQNLLQINLQDTRVYSDFVSMYLLVFLLFIIALLTAFLLSFNKDWRKKNHNFFEIVRYVAIAYLTVHLLKYGVDKIFKNQFYKPEPHNLFTAFVIGVQWALPTSILFFLEWLKCLQHYYCFSIEPVCRDCYCPCFYS